MHPRRLFGALGSLAMTMGSRLSLRARLLLGLLGVAAVGLVVADAVVYGQIKSYLNDQVHTELITGAQSTINVLRHSGPNGASRLPFDTVVEVVSTSGNFVFADPANFRLQASGASLANRTPGTTFTALGRTGKVTGSFLVTPRPVGVCVVGACFLPSQAVPAVALVAIPLSLLQGTLNQLLIVEAAVSGAVLLALVFLGYFVVRVGMRPLLAIEETAGAIAAGDLSRRVAHDDAGTEVGRLGAALNAMLSTIERAFGIQRASEERLRRFLADASHELRTPVTSIRGYAELFRRGAANRPEDLALAMRRIEEEAQRMGLLVEDLLLLARLDQGRPIEREQVDLAALAIDAAADAQVLAPERPITVEANDAVLVLGDEQRLRQVVSNLVQNALRHTPELTPVSVAVTAAGGRACLSVHDEGPGLVPEEAARVFERFYRADPSRTRGSGGTGLGLSIVASIAAAHGGTARVETALGAGATFIVELPLHEPASSERSQEAGSDSALEVRRVVEAAQRPARTGDDEGRDRRVVAADERERA